MAGNMITGKETQKMQEYTQERINQAERRGVEFSTDVKEQIFEYANLIGEEEKVRTLVRNLADAVSQADQEGVEDLLDDVRMDIQEQQKIWCHLEKKQPWIITEWVLRFIALEVMAVKVNMRVKK